MLWLIVQFKLFLQSFSLAVKVKDLEHDTQTLKIRMLPGMALVLWNETIIFFLFASLYNFLFFEGDGSIPWYVHTTIILRITFIVKKIIIFVQFLESCIFCFMDISDINTFVSAQYKSFNV